MDRDSSFERPKLFVPSKAYMQEHYRTKDFSKDAIISDAKTGSLVLDNVIISPPYIDND